MADAEATRYFVEMNGQRFGPADLDTLRKWSLEGRVTPDSVLVEESSGRRLIASDLKGLFAEGSPSVAMPFAEAPRLSQPVYGEPRQGTPAWVGLSCLTVVVGVLAAILVPVFRSAKVAAHNTTAISNMKQLAIAALVYTNDFDDRFPPTMASALRVKPYLLPYTRSSWNSSYTVSSSTETHDDIFVSMNSAGGEILGDRRLGGRSADDLADPAAAVMFFDDRPWPDGRGLLCFTDASARFTTFDVIKKGLTTDLFIAPKGTSKR